MSREFLRFNHANPPSAPEELPGYLNETFIELGAVVDLLARRTLRRSLRCSYEAKSG